MSGHRPLFILAFDHRVVLTTIFAGANVEPKLRNLALAKTIVLEALDAAVAQDPRVVGSSGILVDEEYGSHVALLAKSRGHIVAMPVEMSETFPMTIQFGEDMTSHITAFDPTYVKTLVRYNVGADSETNDRQARSLRTLTEWSRDAGHPLMVEVLVPPTDRQKDRVGGDLGRYQAELLPDLIANGVASLREHGVSPDIWKLEGLNTAEQSAMVAAACVDGADRDVRCIVLGRGESAERVGIWIEAAAKSGRFDGFAIGRTIWREAVVGYFSGQISREAAVASMAQRYLSYVQPFLAAQTSQGSSSARATSH